MGGKHNLKYQGANRIAPDPDLYPFYIMNKQGLWLHWKVWHPMGVTPKAVVLGVHGLGEHVARYDGFFNYLNKQGYVVYMMEHQGHGGSEGDRKYVEKFDDYIDDQLQFITDVIGAAEGGIADLPRVLFGHSMGGLIATHIAMRSQSSWKGLLLSGPAMKADPKAATPFMKSVANKLSNFAPHAGVAALDASTVSRNRQVVEFYIQDPLVPMNKLTARWAAELMVAMEAVVTNGKQLTLPTLVCHGEEDKLAMPEGSKEFINTIGSEDKKLIVYPNLFHEILNEEKASRDVVRQDMLTFLDRVVGGSGGGAATSAE